MAKNKRLKLKIRQHEEVEKENKKFDIILLLQTELQDTKPNMGKFLKLYVLDIRLFISSKVLLYPEFKYEIGKVFVRFLDGHELIKDYHANKSPGFETPEFFMYFKCDEIQLKEKELKLVAQFFNFLEQFKFIK